MSTTKASANSNGNRPLAESITAATRPAHAKLNKLIISRLPLALPPRAADPGLYVSGLLHIAPIYITFEALWQNILDTPQAAHDTEASAGQEAPTAENVLTVLDRLYLPDLLRSSRLRDDIRATTGWPDHVVEEQLRIVSQSGRLAEFLGHIKRSVENRPHVLLSYSYIFFMALFSGGRFIRASLESAGDDFWNHIPSPIKPTMQTCDGKQTSQDVPEPGEGHRKMDPCHTMPLRFFHFPTPSDGEDLKSEFKKRLSESETALTDREKHDIVQESVCIFENMTLLMHQLDSVCGDQLGVDLGDYTQLLSLSRNMLSARLRDSVAVAKERRSAKSSSRQSSSSEEGECGVDQEFQDQVEEQTVSPQGDTLTKAQTFPQATRVPGMESCPAMSNKSVRFEKPSPHPQHGHPPPYDGSLEELGGSLRLTSKSMRSARLSHWVLVAAFGAIIFGAFVTGRRGLAGW